MLDNGTCSNVCPDGYYADNNTLTCKKDAIQLAKHVLNLKLAPHAL